jgi:hypothetical protein
MYLTRARLMLESERSVEDRASADEEVSQRVCRQLLADRPRYSLWYVRHAGYMGVVAASRNRRAQILSLRSISISQVHRTALVRYLREQCVTGRARDRALREFYAVTDPREAAIIEHRNYLVAASTQFCAADILEMIGDHDGLELLRRYEVAYGQYFAMFSERTRARQMGTPYLLAALLPEVRSAAEWLRARIMDDRCIAPEPLRLVGLRLRGVRSEPLDPRAQVELERPRARRLSMQREIGRRNRVRLEQGISAATRS